jgi:hypothetical protein
VCIPTVTAVSTLSAAIAAVAAVTALRAAFTAPAAVSFGFRIAAIAALSCASSITADSTITAFASAITAITTVAAVRPTSAARPTVATLFAAVSALSTVPATRSACATGSAIAPIFAAVTAVAAGAAILALFSVPTIAVAFTVLPVLTGVLSVCSIPILPGFRLALLVSEEIVIVLCKPRYQKLVDTAVKSLGEEYVEVTIFSAERMYHFANLGHDIYEMTLRQLYKRTVQILGFDATFGHRHEVRRVREELEPVDGRQYIVLRLVCDNLHESYPVRHAGVTRYVFVQLFDRWLCHRAAERNGNPIPHFLDSRGDRTARRSNRHRDRAGHVSLVAHPSLIHSLHAHFSDIRIALSDDVTLHIAEPRVSVEQARVDIKSVCAAATVDFRDYYVVSTARSVLPYGIGVHPAEIPTVVIQSKRH